MGAKMVKAIDDAEEHDFKAPMMELGDFYRIVVGRLRLLAPSMLIAFSLALAYIFLSPVRYTAVMSLMVDPRERGPVGSEAPTMPQVPDAALLESQVRLLTSRPVLKKVVESQDLVRTEPTSGVSALLRAISMLFGSAGGELTPTEAAIAALEKSISMKRNERSYIVEVEVKGPTREKAVQIAQALADAFISSQGKLADDIIDKQTKWLDLKVRDLRQRVAEAEQRVQEYRENEQIAISDGRSSFEAQLKDANTALIAAQGRRADLEARYAQIKAGTAGAGTAGNEWLRSGVIEKLRMDYATLSREEAFARTTLGPLHPNYRTILKQLDSLKAQIAAEKQRIASATSRELEAAVKAEREAARLVTDLEAKNNKLGDKRLELTKLEREAVAVRAAYEKSLLARENVRKDVVAAPLVLLVDPPAAPPSPSSPKTIPALLIAFAAGLNMWIGSALIAERRSNGREAPPVSAKVGFRTSRTPAMRRFTAAAPNLYNQLGPRGRSDQRHRHALNVVADVMKGRNPYAEAFDDILDRLNRQFDEGETATVCIASATPHSGASTVALSLAYAAATRGEKVLIVDENYSRPQFTALARNTKPLRLNRLQRIAGLLWRDLRSSGAILVTPIYGQLQDSNGSDVEEKFDLTLIDIGELSLAAKLMRNTSAIDGLLVVAKRDADLSEVEESVANEGLGDDCIGMILTASPRADSR